jgi:hypothetical protein
MIGRIAAHRTSWAALLIALMSIRSYTYASTHLGAVTPPGYAGFSAI